MLRTASALSTRSPVIGQIPPLASVAAMTLPDSQVTSMEHNWDGKKMELFELEMHEEQLGRNILTVWKKENVFYC